jgi:SAM-dependent methyltransferase
LTVFAGYSRYYDLLYKDKDYAAEARYVAELIRRHSPAAESLMEIGCGTGAHAVELAALGFSVAGVDMSEGMLEMAEARRASTDSSLASRIAFSHGDARTVELDRRFDAVVSLFHVMSYQTSNEDLLAAFNTAANHLDDGGVFVFDCWYGPAVLKQWPAVTEKKLEDESTSIFRTATPVTHANENIVDVNYTVDVTDRITGTTETLNETHRMRYLFKPEIELALSSVGLELIDSRGWMTMNEPGFDTWGACFVARK